MSIQNNIIPASVMKEWQEDAERKWPFDKSTYISGRQDEWVKQNAEIERLKGLIQEAHSAGRKCGNYTDKQSQPFDYDSFKQQYKI